MRYRIEYTDGRHCSFVGDSKSLIQNLKLLKHEAVADIRKLYKSGVSDSVMNKYKKYISGRC